MENVINFNRAGSNASEKRWSCYRSALQTRAIALAPVAIDIFFPRYVESATKGQKEIEKAREREKSNYLARKCRFSLQIAHRIVRLICYEILFTRRTVSFTIVNSVPMTLLMGNHNSRSFLRPPYSMSVGL